MNNGRPDPIDRPESYPVTTTVTTAQQRARARITLALTAHDRDDLALLLRALKLDDPTEIRAQLAHRERNAA